MGALPAWEDLTEHQRSSVRHGVALAMDLANDIDVRGAYEECQRLPEKLHESWLEEKRQDGWTYSTIKDSDAKTHPCMLPWA